MHQRVPWRPQWRYREPTRPKPWDAISQQYENVSSVNIIAGNFADSATHVLVHGRLQLSDFLILLLRFDRSVALPNYCWRKLVALIRPPSRNHVIFALFKCNNFTVSQEHDNQTPNSEKIKSCDFSLSFHETRICVVTVTAALASTPRDLNLMTFY